MTWQYIFKAHAINSSELKDQAIIKNLKT